MVGVISGNTRERSERRQLTVMFCDMVDSTVAAERLDPEDYAIVLHAYHECCADVASRFDGTITQYLGDGLRILFGYPQAHEDDPERAVLAGLEIVEQVAKLELKELDENGLERVEVRVGIATGLVVVGDLLGEPSTEEMAVFGDTPNLAARLQAAAPRNAVVVSPATKRLLANVFDCRNLGMLSLKGFSEPINAWEVLAAEPGVSRFELLHGAHLTTMVNRSHELKELAGLWARAREGSGQVGYVIGDPGIGKSRVVREFLERYADGSTQIFNFQCSRYHLNSSLYPVIAEFRRRTEGTAINEGVDDLGEYVRTQISNGESIAPFFASLLSLPSRVEHQAPLQNAKQIKREAFIACIDLLAHMAVTKPMMIVVEDVHWLDPTSTELLTLLRERVVGARVLVLVTARPEFDLAENSYAHEQVLSLDPLEAGDCFRIAQNLIDTDKIPHHLIDRVLEKAEGNPLFIEELVRSAFDFASLGEKLAHLGRAAFRIAIPASIQDSLSSRLDRLGSARELAQIGAVIGREFRLSMVTGMTAMPASEITRELNILLKADILNRRDSGGDVTYVFKHALIQDAAYGTLLKKNRRRLHAQVAEQLEANYPERVKIEPEVLAHHYTEAEKADDAVRFWELAAKRALQHSANEELINYVMQGRDLLRELEDPDARNRFELEFEILLGAAYRATKGFSANEVEESFSRAYVLCEELGDHEKIIDILRGLFACYYVRAELGTALQQADLVLAKAADVPDVKMMGHWMRGCILFWQGRFQESGVELFQSIALYDEGGRSKQILASQIDPGLNAYIHLIWNQWIVGRVDEAVSISERAIDHARELKQPFAIAMALWWACVVRIYRGENHLARTLCDELQVVSSEYNLSYLNAVARILDGFIDGEHNSGDGADSEHKIDEAWEMLHEQAASLGQPWSYSIFITLHLQNGRLEQGLDLVDRALACCELNGEYHWLAEIYRLQGELLLALDNEHREKARGALELALETANEQGAMSLELRAANSLARLLAQEQDYDAAFTILTSVYLRFDEGHGTRDMKNAESLIEELRLKL